MKQYFYFFFDKRNNFCCINEYNNHYRKYKNDDAKDILAIADNINIQKIVIENGKMNLISSNNVITFDDYNKIFGHRYEKLIPNIKEKFDNSIKGRLFYFNSRPKNATLYTDDYKNKKIIKTGVITLFSGLAIVGSISLHKAGFNLNKEHQAVRNICYTMSESYNVIQDFEKIVNDSNYLIELVKTRKEENTTDIIDARDYQSFTSYNDETKYAYDNYYDIVYDEASKIGVDPNLVMAMLIQESHGRRANLMQISYSSWANHSFNYYDFKDREYKKITLTSNELNTPEGNIRAACLILRLSVDRMNKNIMAGVQCYNLGTGNMDHVINVAANAENMDKDELLANQDDLLFVPYTKYAHGGDKNYIKNISRYLNETDYIYYLDVDKFGNTTQYKYNLKEKTKTLKKL